MADAETLLLAVTKDGTVKIGLPPSHVLDDYPARAKDAGKLENAKHVLCSPEGELFCVRDGDLYRGPLPSKKGVDWFSIARRVGKGEWSQFKHLFFHPNGELYGITDYGELYKGPQPDNENVPWKFGRGTKIAVDCDVFFYRYEDENGIDEVKTSTSRYKTACFDTTGVLYAVTKEDKLVKGNPPTTLQEGTEWLKTTTVVGEGGWIAISHFMSFSPDGKLWTVNRENGKIYRGFIPDDGKYVDNADFLGWGYHYFRFLSFTKDKTIRDIISFNFLPERGEKLSESPEVIEQKIYDNRRSSSTLKHNFIFDKTVKTSSSFSHEHGFTFEVGTTLTFKAGIPCIAETEASVHMNLSTTNTWSFTETNETQVKFSSSSDVEVPAGKAIRMVASVMKAQMNVPYRARVRTLFGSEAEVEGTWTGATVYNLMVTQEDYNK